MDERYSKLATPPVSALKAITGGTLSGKANINPQWKIQAVTEVYGLCGIGWKYEIADKQIIDCPDGQKLIYLTVALQVKDGDQWSAPIYGIGGDLIIKKRGSGLLADDDAYKKCLTDALGNAMKNIGVAADVYREMFDTKYGEFVRTEPKDETPQTSNKKEVPEQKTYAKKQDTEEKETKDITRKATQAELKKYIDTLNERNINPDYFTKRFFKKKKEEMTISEVNYTLNNIENAMRKFYRECLHEAKGRQSKD
jgi:hypothetical protein